MEEFFDPVVVFTTKFSDKLIEEISSRGIDFYLYLIPPALIPWITSKIIPDPLFKTYIDILIITIYTSVLWDITSDS
tara:strand:- start:864 stop:1094 length:231 start_codon:yes stop_codon:yes gene_type:complete